MGARRLHRGKSKMRGSDARVSEAALSNSDVAVTAVTINTMRAERTFRDLAGKGKQSKPGRGGRASGGTVDLGKQPAKQAWLQAHYYPTHGYAYRREGGFGYPRTAGVFSGDTAFTKVKPPRSRAWDFETHPDRRK